MAWWQKKLLRFALSRTGLLDHEALDLDNLGITLGKQNVVELKEVGLNIQRISKLAQLPPGLRLQTARVLSLRLTVPADIYQSGIVAEIDGLELSLKLEETEPNQDSTEKRKSRRARSPESASSPQHRKAHRRSHSPPPYDPGGLDGFPEAYIPTTEELAKSFLLEEPVQGRRQLEASVAPNNRGVEESFASESSGSDEVGTGAAVGLPGFLAGFLQGIVDRLQVRVKQVIATLETTAGEDADRSVPVTIKLRVGDASMDKGLDDSNRRESRRKINLSDISLELVSDAGIFDELSELTSPNSPVTSRQSGLASPLTRTSTRMSVEPQLSAKYGSIASSQGSGLPHSPLHSPDLMRASVATADTDRFADAREEEQVPSSAEASQLGLDIQAGDDNISWGSRRSKSSAPAQDLWKSMASEDDLPESLVLERTSTPRAHSSRHVSPNISRKRRNVSPYGRSLQSPGSWPSLEEHTDRYHPQRSPGSWPTLEQSQHSFFQPLIPAYGVPSDVATDNKRMAMEGSHMNDPTPEPHNWPSDNATEDLTTSRVFTHEEARSMYMSAMSYGSRMHVPGGWSPEETPSERPGSPEDARHALSARPEPRSLSALHHAPSPAPAFDDDLAYGERPYSTPEIPLSGNVTPRVPTPERVKRITNINSAAREVSKQLAFIDTILLLLPTSGASTEEPDLQNTPHMVSSRSSALHNMPGAFSAYSELAASRGKLETSTALSRQEPYNVLSIEDKDSPADDAFAFIGIDIGSVKCQMDISCAKLLYRLLPLSKLQRDAASESPAVGVDTTESIKKPLSLSADNFWIVFRDTVNGQLQHREASYRASDDVAALACQQFVFTTSHTDTEIRVATLKAYLGSSCLLSFDRGLSPDTSLVLTEQTPDVALTVSKELSPIKRPVTKVDVVTLCINVLLDLPVVDEAFEFLGGLSGVLEAGNSILSEGGIGSSQSPPLKSTKGVRFAGEPEHINKKSELKLNARLAGLSTILQGSACHVLLRTSTVRAVYREQGIVGTVEQVRVSGPHGSSNAAAPITADLAAVRLEYLSSPQDKDLERLLNMLTPSKDRYDTDDDILLDTLLRQRRKGGLVRLSVGTTKTKCYDWSCLDSLKDLSSELSRLSAVAKYLPEDDRPGVLLLIRIKEYDARLPVNESFGMLHISATELQCAQVGLPALLALSIGSVHASQGGEIELVHPLVPSSAVDNLPMLMARRLGDEIEPNMKIKLFNVAVEYSVPVLLDLTGLDRESDTDEVVAELSRSLANLAGSKAGGEAMKQLPVKATSTSETKRLKLEVLVHDSGLGLSPQKLSSKGLLVLADALISTTVPPEDTASATVEFRKAGLFMADRAIDDDVDMGIPDRGAPSNTAVNPKLTSTLSRQGFVSVASIMSAKVSVHTQQDHESGDNFIEVDVGNKLLLLETCADSTQTLIATLNGLAPPTPPSKQPKYLTEPLSIEDMMASFTGEAFAKPEQKPQTLFDVEEEPEDDPGTLLDMPAFEEDDDGLLAESEMTSSLYGPVSGVFGIAGEPDDRDDASEYFTETAESLLEDDPFEMTIPPPDAPLGDTALIRELNKQCKSAIADETLDLDLYGFEDVGFDALGGTATALGTMYRFNTPVTAGRKLARRNPQRKLPFRLRLRDLHVIWNIYDGYDWQRTRDGITEAVEQVEYRAEQRKAKRRRSPLQDEDSESVIGDFLFNSIYIGVPSNQDAQDLRRQINRHIDDLASETESVPVSGISRPSAYSALPRPRTRRRLKLERSRAHKIAFELKGVSADVLVFPPDSADILSTIDVRVKDFEIFDNVPTSTWRKFLTHLDDDPYGREMSKPMVHLELLKARTLEHYAASELSLHVSLLPLRLHVDQDALDFITRFFEFKDESVLSIGSPSDQPFIQRVEVDTVDLRLDYKPKTVDYAGLRSGHTNEFMNFIILDAANIRLKHAIIYGIAGFEPLHKTLNDIWMPDVKRNQLPTVLAGLAPVRSLVNIGSGVRDVVAIPIREYKKDGRIVRSIQKGAFQFGKTTASELARLGAKVAIGTQTFLQGAEGLLTPGSASPSGRPAPSRRSPSDHGWHDVDEDDEDHHERRAISAYANQPLSVFGGLRSARRYLEHDLLTARDALIAVQGEVLESSTAGSAAAAVVRHAPTVILRPIIGTSRAVGTALMGVGNAIDRDNARRIDDKYKRR